MSTSSQLTLVSSAKCFGGFVNRYSHRSAALKCEMKFSVYLPPQAEKGKVPALWFLSGLTCTDENFITKAGAQREAARLGIALIAPDTSPRGLNIPGESASWDFGVGAGFYLNASQEPWSGSWQMYTYITSELFDIVNQSFPISGAHSITGHSMGGHGALVLALKNPGKYKSVSAFAPIVNPCDCPWGHKAFSGYLGADNKDAWKSYDATHLVASYQGPDLHLLIDQGTGDKFLAEQLKPQNFEAACKQANVALTLRMQDGYDHSYYFISTFIADHLEHHAKYLL